MILLIQKVKLVQQKPAQNARYVKAAVLSEFSDAAHCTSTLTSLVLSSVAMGAIEVCQFAQHCKRQNRSKQNTAVSNFLLVSGRRNTWYTDTPSPTGFLKHVLPILKVGVMEQFFPISSQLGGKDVSWVAGMATSCGCTFLLLSPQTALKEHDTAVGTLKHKSITSHKLYYQPGSKTCLFCSSRGNHPLEKNQQNSFRQSSYTFSNKRQYTPTQQHSVNVLSQVLLSFTAQSRYGLQWKC